jgi:hypothetical protein
MNKNNFNEFQTRFDQASDVLMCKGENQKAVKALLTSREIAVADINGVKPRRLHPGL